MKRIQSTMGKHLIINAYGIKRKKLENLQAIKKLLRDLPKKIGMRPLGREMVKKVASNFYPTRGISGFVMLYESHISLHTWPEKGCLAMDLHSCKDFNHNGVIKFLKEYWGCKKMKTRVVMRG